jgi:hypothetical protein
LISMDKWSCCHSFVTTGKSFQLYGFLFRKRLLVVLPRSDMNVSLHCWDMSLPQTY